ncbi:Uncharacterized protein FWK35_00018261, partial [Aphis craccivora]
KFLWSINKSKKSKTFENLTNLKVAIHPEKDDPHVEINNTTVISEISNQININNAPCETDFPSTKINTENAIILMYQAGINLTISLHNNTNFTRKDVVNIQKEFFQILFKPIADLLKNVVNYLIKDPLLLSSFHTIISAISAPFKLCNSEYNLDIRLKNNNLYSHINQFTINNEINLVSSLSETNYNEHITKGILMPLQFQFKSYFEYNDNLHSTLTEYERLMNTSDNTVLAHFVQVTNLNYSVDMKQFVNDLCLQTLIHELNKLEVDGLLVDNNLVFFCKLFFADFAKKIKVSHKNHQKKIEDINTNDFKLTSICHYNLCHIIKYYTETVHIFSLDTLNLRKQNFNYGCIEIDNISPLIKINNINEFHLKMTAQEMMTFVHFFSLMVGDLIPDDDPVWIKNKYSPFIPNSRKLNHPLSYVLLFQDNFKPKHHILLHYPSIIRKSGPPKHFWCFRFEAKHKDLKTYARNIINEIHKITSSNTKFILNNINSFHVTTNFCVDVMHDIFDGVCHYDMCHTVTYYTDTVNVSALETFNFRTQHFIYGELEQKILSLPIEK